MKYMAEWIHRSIVKTIIKGIIWLILSFCLLFLFISTELVPLAVFSGLLILAVCFFTALNAYMIIKTNREDTPPIYIEGNNIFCYNGKAILEFPMSDLYYAKGKNKKYFHVFAGFITWGTRNYGKICICFDNEGKKEKFYIKNVYEPKKAAQTLMQYVECQATGVENHVNY